MASVSRSESERKWTSFQPLEMATERASSKAPASACKGEMATLFGNQDRRTSFSFFATLATQVSEAFNDAPV